jgi:hypothetical protein
MIVPRRLDAAVSEQNQKTYGTAVGLVLPQDWGNAIFNGGTLAQNVTATSAAINVAGYNSFMFLGRGGVGAGYSIKYNTLDYADTVTPFGPIFTDTVGSVVPPATKLLLGAPSGVRPGDTFGWLTITLTGLVATGCDNIFVTMLCSYR